MLSNLNKYKLILASNSPRRQELMKGLGVEFEVRTLPDLDESYPPILKGEKIPLYIAREKATAYLPSMQPDELIITADTIVWKDGEVLGKPANKAEAKEMLHTLSGGCHQVVTGVCLTTREWQRGFTSVTDVKFAPLTEEVIDYYVENFSPLDKAGAYGIQEWIGYAGVESISGSYFNVMGLPVHKLYKELVKL